jgi:gamma-glutamylcyclotransferase (GGCT)/AIG2-like uncharacterized protein YtfP
LHLFVYGTLKRGQPRHRFLSGQEFIAAARTSPHYRLYHLGEYPGLVERAAGLSIAGELWDVDDSCLIRLDRVEGCDQGLYRRGPIKLAGPHDEVSAVTYFYLKNVDGCPECGTRW